MKIFSLQWRGTLLVVFPLLCQSFFIFAVIYMLMNAQMSLEIAIHMREVVVRLNQESGEFLDNVVFQDEKLKDFGKGTPTEMNSMERFDVIVKELPPEQTKDLRARIRDMIAIYNDSVNLLTTKQIDKSSVRREVFQKIFRSIPLFMDELNKVMYTNDALRKTQFDKFTKIKNDLIDLVTLAIIASFVVGAAMFAVFTISIKRPIERITENSKRLSKKMPLRPLLKGQDELNQLDRSLHRTYEAVMASSERELALINNVADLVCSLNKEGVFLESNAASNKILEMSPESLKGNRICDIAVSHQSLLADEYLRKACQPGEVHNFELKLRNASGKEIETQWSSVWSPLQHRLFCVVRDITAEKELSRMKQDFIDMVSHDLRSPLTSLGITLEVIEKGSMGEINSEAMKEIQATSNNVKILVGLINDLLDFQKLDEGKVQLDKKFCSINEIVREAVSLVKDVAISKQIEIEYTPQDFEVYCDQTKITQTILNLLSNAIKFSPAGSNVCVKVEEEPKENEVTFVKITVSDKGPGIPKDLRQRIFEKYEQAPSHKNQGTGLGLAICKMIVDAHGGTISVNENEGGIGSAFWFEIPTSELASAEAAPEQSLFLD